MAFLLRYTREGPLRKTVEGIGLGKESQKTGNQHQFMEDTKPHPLTLQEWKEVMNVPEVREGWGLEDDATPAEFAARVYGVKFDFVSGSPGYVGDLYILQDDVVGDGPPMVLRRDENGSLTTS